MRKANKSLISLAVVLIAGLNFVVPAFAQDPFSAIAVGGLTGASGAGLFGSMAGMSGIDIGWSQSGSDPMDAMWNVLNPDHVYFSGEKHEADPQTDPADIYDYIQVDIGDWLDAQNDFIKNFVNTNNVTDNDSGTVVGNSEFNGIPFVSELSGNVYSDIIASGAGPAAETTVTIGNWQYSAVCQRGWTDSGSVTFYYNGQAVGGRQMTWGAATYSLRLFKSYNNVYISLHVGTNLQFTAGSSIIGQASNAESTSWTSDTVDTSVFDDWGSAKVKIPHTISGLTPGWTVPDFLDSLNTIWSGAGHDNIIIEDGDNPGPVPPQPLPDTPLGDVPFDDWVDLWGQSIWDNLTRIEEKAELMVINQNDGLESIDDLEGLGEDILEGTNDLVGLATDIDENLEDMITYEQGISEDVEDIGENVEDIEDEVIVIVDEMGNVIDVLEGIDAKIYAQGQTIGSISTEVGTVADAAEAIQTEVEAQTETQEEIKEAVEDLVPYVVPLPDIASDTETMVDILPDIATATQTSTQTLTDTLPDIKDATETITETLPDIITEIQDATTTLTDDIPNIDDICLNIDEAPYKDLETGVDRLPRIILPFITDLRSALGIWHYVTEWLAQISTTFAFISGCLVGTSIMTPIYAGIAGFMCIKVYRRMCS